MHRAAVLLFGLALWSPALRAAACAELLWAGKPALARNGGLAARVARLMEDRRDVIVAATRKLSAHSLLIGVGQTPDVLCHPVCNRVSAVIEYILEGEGYDVDRLLATPPHSPFQDHIFVRVRARDEEVLIDGSWLQFSREFHLNGFDYAAIPEHWIAVVDARDADRLVDRLMAFWDAKLGEWERAGGSLALLHERVEIFRRPRAEIALALQQIWRGENTRVVYKKGNLRSQYEAEPGDEVYEWLRSEGLK